MWLKTGTSASIAKVIGAAVNPLAEDSVLFPSADGNEEHRVLINIVSSWVSAIFRARFQAPVPGKPIKPSPD